MPRDKIELAPDYYLHNFIYLVNWVNERYSDLLNDKERLFITQFQQLSHPAQCLLVRLCGRKGIQFRAAKLQYAEILSIGEAASELVDCNLLQRDPFLSLTELCDILTKAEILELFKSELTSIKQERKEILIENLATAFTHSARWSEWTQGKWGELYACDHKDSLDTIKLLFFGNSHQDLTEFVLQDLGLFQYEKYTIDHQHRLFKHRDEIEDYWLINQLRDELEVATDVTQLVELANRIPDVVKTPKQMRRLAKLTNQLAYRLEMNAGLHWALKLYQRNEQPPARERRVRLLEKLGQHQDAWKQLEQIQQQPVNEHELQIVERMAPRLAKKASMNFTKAATVAICEKRILLPRQSDEHGNFLSVEAVASQHFNQTGDQCFYVENQLFNSLFGLWLWPEMFRGVDGAFANAFQMAPLDMYQENFIDNRQGLTELWNQLDNNKHSTKILDTWQEKFGIANHWVFWDLDVAVLQTALDIIPANHLKAIFQHILFDPHSNRSGFPDLILFSPANKTYQLIEIKGPGDRLQDNQVRWLEFFNQQQIPAEVCYVDWE
jgi:hypothetical protein